MIPSIFRSREKFLVLEITSKGTSGLFMSIDEDRNLIFEKLEKKINLRKFLKAPLRSISQKSWEGKYFFESRRTIIATADSSLATTIPVPLDLNREPHYAHEKITITELENLIARAQIMIFNQCRNEAGRRLHSEDIHTILVASKANHFKVDGRAVESLIDYSGKKISLLLELTFTRREIFEDLKPLFASPEGLFFAESSQVRLVSVARVRNLPLALVSANDENATLFVLTKTKGGHGVLYREKMAWSFSLIFDAIRKDFHVSLPAAREIYAAYCAKKTSVSATRVLKRTIQPAVEAFLQDIKKSKISGSIYIDAPYAIPFDVPLKTAGVACEHTPIPELLSEFNFSTEMKEVSHRPGAVFRYLAPFLEAYFDKSNSEINQKLRRRLHWLAQ